MNRSASDLIGRRNNRTIFADIVVQKKNVAGGRLLRPVYVTDYSSGVLTDYAEGAVETTPAELEGYIGTPATVPAAPVDLSGTIGDGFVTITFTPGSNGGSAITDYECSIDGGAFASLGITESPATISGLNNGESYTFILHAVNSVGTGANSDPITLTPATVPSAPTGLSVTAGDTEVTITFTAGATGGSAITNYKYSLNNGASYSAFSPVDTASPVTITGLTNGTTYQVKLRAVNAIGDGAESLAVSAVPLPSGNVYTSPTTNVGVDISSVSPFVGGGYSYNFNGSSDYITISGDNSWALGTGAFTIEWFQYQTDNNDFPRIFATDTDSIGCSIESGTLYPWLNENYPISVDVDDYKDIWTHFAIVRDSSGTINVYKNGNSLGSGSDTTNITNNISTLFIGVQKIPTEFNTWFGGYLTNIRIVKGLAVYTGSFTVPTSALTLTAGENPYGGSNTEAIPAGFTKLLLVPTIQTIQTFTTVGTTTWTAPEGVTSVSYLTVGGGGGGGGGYDTGAGGGGGGGMVLTGTLAVTAGQSYSVTVGAGGAASSNTYPTIRETDGGTGENSSFSSIIALGGSGGYGSRQPPGGNNKAGGVAVISNTTAAEGGRGGGSNGGGGGGGGSSENGSNGITSTGGNGGSGTSNNISGSAVTYGTGGKGGNGSNNNPGSAASANSGNGGNGGGAAAGGARNGGAGGSGIVIITY